MLTPAMQQYYDIKKDYEDSVVFFRMWDFYEMFGEDAHIAHRVLWIHVTTRNKNATNPEPLAGFPYHAKEKYLPLLIEAWYKVAIVEQVSDPKLKWIVKREVVRVVTPTTLWLEWDNFDDKNTNDLLVSITKKDEIYGLSLLYISNGEWKTTQFNTFEKLALELYKLNPKEVVLEKKLFQESSIQDILQKKYSLNIYYYESKNPWYESLLRHFQTKNLEWFWIEKFPQAIEASALLLAYLEYNQKQSLWMLQKIWLMSTGMTLEIDASTLRSLDILYNFSTGSETLWTLYGVLNQTHTAMWKRLLKQYLLHPSREKEEIIKRQNFIEAFIKHPILLDNVRQHLKYVADIDAILNRIALQRMTPKDLLNLKKSLQSLLEIQKIILQSEVSFLKKIFQ